MVSLPGDLNRLMAALRTLRENDSVAFEEKLNRAVFVPFFTSSVLKPAHFPHKRFSNALSVEQVPFDLDFHAVRSDCRRVGIVQGLFEAVTFRLFNLAGVPAPHTHYLHLRIIDEPEENPASQYEGDFWGLYLATEEIDDNFLEEHDLPDGNIYKWDFGQPKPEHLAAGSPTNRQDIVQFVRAYQQMQPDEWWRQNVDLHHYFSYRSILECVHHYDIANGKNYFYYFNPTARYWIVLPWDVDLTWSQRVTLTRRPKPVTRSYHPSLRCAWRRTIESQRVWSMPEKRIHNDLA